MRLRRFPPDRFAEFIEARSAPAHQVRAAASARRSSSWPATCPTTCSASRTRCGTMPARGKAPGLDDLHGTLTRLLGEHDALRGDLAAAHARAARGAAGRRARGRTRAPVAERARAIAWAAPPPCRLRSPRSCAKTSSPARAPATSSSIRCSASGSRGEPSDAHARLLDRSGSAAAICAPGRCTTGPTPRSRPRSSPPSSRSTTRRSRPPGCQKRWRRAASPGRPRWRSSSSRSSRRCSARSPTTRR